MSSKTSIAERAGFTFYRSFRDVIDRIAPEEQLSLYKAIANYALDGTLPDVDSMGSSSSLCWMMIQPILQSGLTKYLNGKLGGAPEGNANALKNNLKSTKKQPKNNLKSSKKQPKNNLKSSNINENENENKEKDSKEKSADKPRRTRSRVSENPPTVEEVEMFFEANGYTQESARKAYAYYADGNWLDSKGNPVLNWKQKCRAVWFKPENEAQKTLGSGTVGGYAVLTPQTARMA